MTISIHDANDVITKTVTDRLIEIETKLNGDVLFYHGPITPPVDDLMRDTIEEIQNKKSKLIVILETNGGYAETANRIVNIFRKHYPDCVDFIIPNYAMSAGTILVMSGDNIYMDYYSILGPIDPQIERPDGKKGLIPALGYLIKYDEFIKKAQNGKLSTDEAAFFIKKFDPAELYNYEQERALSKMLLEQWLVKYKFKNWNVTETQKIPVDEARKKQVAGKIADDLNNPDKWHSHSLGISIEVLRRDLCLQINDFETDPLLNTSIRNYYKLLKDYMEKRNHDFVIHTRTAYFGV